MNASSLTRNQAILLIAGVFVILFFVGSIVSNSSRSSINTADEYAPAGSPAGITDSEDLYKLINNSQQFMSVRKDVSQYGQLAIPEYLDNTDKLINFIKTSKATETDDGNITFKGHYQNNKDEIEVVVELLNNSQVRTSITNLKNNGNIDSKLPSNSPFNQFVATLPFQNDDYKIEYTANVDAFVVTAISPKESNREDSEKYITEKTGIASSELKILYKPYLF